MQSENSIFKSQSAKPPAANSTICAKCNSADTQSFLMAYESGTSSGNLSVSTYSQHGGIGVAGGKTKNQTLLAKKLEPPRKPQWTFGELFAVPFLILITFLVAQSFIGLPGGLFLGVAVGGLMWLYVSYKISNQLPIYEKELRIWSKSWVCLRCGESWLMRTR